jgi:hypothetical protein
LRRTRKNFKNEKNCQNFTPFPFLGSITCFNSFNPNAGTYCNVLSTEFHVHSPIHMYTQSYVLSSHFSRAS